MSSPLLIGLKSKKKEREIDEVHEEREKCPI
jgi:hypothetical protein